RENDSCKPHRLTKPQISGTPDSKALDRSYGAEPLRTRNSKSRSQSKALQRPTGCQHSTGCSHSSTATRATIPAPGKDADHVQIPRPALFEKTPIIRAKNGCYLFFRTVLATV